MNHLPTLNWKRLSDLPDREGFAGSYAGTHNDALIVCGGANFPDKPLWEGGPKVWTDEVFYMNDIVAGWREAAPLPKPLGYGATASLPEGVLLIGGSNAQEGAIADCYLLSFADGEVRCTPSAPLPYPLTGHAAAVIDGKVYVTGGSRAVGEQDAESALLIYDPKSDSWSEGPALPARGRFLHQSCAVNHTLYVLGGIGLKPAEEGDRMMRDMLTEAWAYCADMGWRRLSDLPHPCAAAPTPAPIFEGRVFLLGGDDASVTGYAPQDHPGFNKQSLAYDIAHDLWQDAGTVAAARAVLPCAQWHGRAVIINGEQRPGKRSNEVWSIQC